MESERVCHPLHDTVFNFLRPHVNEADKFYICDFEEPSADLASKYCAKLFYESKESLTEHKRTHSCYDQCLLCNVFLPTAADVIRHVEKYHGDKGKQRERLKTVVANYKQDKSKFKPGLPPVYSKACLLTDFLQRPCIQAYVKELRALKANTSSRCLKSNCSLTNQFENPLSEDYHFDKNSVHIPQRAVTRQDIGVNTDPCSTCCRCLDLEMRIQQLKATMQAELQNREDIILQLKEQIKGEQDADGKDSQTEIQKFILPNKMIPIAHSVFSNVLSFEVMEQPIRFMLDANQLYNEHSKKFDLWLKEFQLGNQRIPERVQLAQTKEHTSMGERERELLVYILNGYMQPDYEPRIGTVRKDGTIIQEGDPRSVIIDGASVGYYHANTVCKVPENCDEWYQAFFDGILAVVQYFNYLRSHEHCKELRFPLIAVCLSELWMWKKVTDQNEPNGQAFVRRSEPSLIKLCADGYLNWVPAHAKRDEDGRLNFQCTFDTPFIIDAAAAFGGFVVSNTNFDQEARAWPNYSHIMNRRIPVYFTKPCHFQIGYNCFEHPNADHFFKIFFHNRAGFDYCKHPVDHADDHIQVD